MGVALFPVLSGHQGAGERTRITGSNTKAVAVEGVFGRPFRSSALDKGVVWLPLRLQGFGLWLGKHTHRWATKIYTRTCGVPVGLYSFSVTASCSAGGAASVPSSQPSATPASS